MQFWIPESSLGQYHFYFTREHYTCDYQVMAWGERSCLDTQGVASLLPFAKQKTVFRSGKLIAFCTQKTVFSE